jgi:hypothetical protein
LERELRFLFFSIITSLINFNCQSEISDANSSLFLQDSLQESINFLLDAAFDD